MKTALTTFAALSIAVLAPALVAGAASPVTSQAAKDSTSIRSRVELARYLRTTPPNRSPLFLLPVSARKRFLDTLVWGSKGVAGLQTGDLEQYLTDAQIHRVLSLFDLQDIAKQMHGRTEPLTEVERDAPPTPLEGKFDKLYFLHFGRPKPLATKAAVSVPRLYDALLAPDQELKALARLSDSDLGLLFRAARIASSSSGDPRYLDHLRLDLAELHRRGLATPERVLSVHDALVAARHFDDADALATKYPAAGVAPLPALRQTTNITGGDPTVLAMEPDGKAMWRKPVDMAVPLRIVVVAGCHFSVDAVRALRADPQLDKLFHEHAVRLADEQESLPAVLDWNRNYPDHPMHVAWRNSEWAMLDSWNMPTFYVFRDGELIDEWAGWPADTGMQTLREHLRQQDLLP